MLVAKLAGYGIILQILNWISSYLEDLELIVKFEGLFYVPSQVLSGVYHRARISVLPLYL